MPATSLPPEYLFVRIRTQWVHLTDEDLHRGLKHRDNFLERLRHRHNLGLTRPRRSCARSSRRTPSCCSRSPDAADCGRRAGGAGLRRAVSQLKVRRGTMPFQRPAPLML